MIMWGPLLIILCVLSNSNGQQSPTIEPSPFPSAVPSLKPHAYPSAIPSVTPSVTPSAIPSLNPTASPTTAPSTPTSTPTTNPTTPTVSPSSNPSPGPSAFPSAIPSTTPSSSPSVIPSPEPSPSPTPLPSAIPSTEPTSQPSQIPTSQPTPIPSIHPTKTPFYTTNQPTVGQTAGLCPSFSDNGQNVISGTTFSVAGGACGIVACPGELITVNGCPSNLNGTADGVTCFGDPMINLYNSAGSLVASNDDASVCSYSSTCPGFTYMLNAASQVFACQTFTVVPGCYQGTSCSGTFWLSSVVIPTTEPTARPSGPPSIKPTAYPSVEPSPRPTYTAMPSTIPTIKPSGAPSTPPTYKPTTPPTFKPSPFPTLQPTIKNGTGLCNQYAGTGSSYNFSTFVSASAPCGVWACPGQIITINGCPSNFNGQKLGVTCAGDPMIEIMNVSGSVLAMNDDSAIYCKYNQFCPYLSYVASGATCKLYDIVPGCFGSKTACSGKFYVTLSLPPTAAPSPAPSIIHSTMPTPNPSLVPTTVPTTAPSSVSRLPTVFPTHRPSPGKGQPTSYPTNSLPVNLKASIQLTNINAAAFQSSPANTVAFKQSVSSFVNGSTPSAVTILYTSSSSTRRYLAGTTPSLSINFTISYNAAAVYSSVSAANAAIASRLAVAVQSGAFASTLSAAAFYDGATALQSAGVNPLSFKLVINTPPSPTLAPTVLPRLSKDGIIAIVVIGTAFLALVAYLAHYSMTRALLEVAGLPEKFDESDLLTQIPGASFIIHQSNNRHTIFIEFENQALATFMVAESKQGKTSYRDNKIMFRFAPFFNGYCLSHLFNCSGEHDGFSGVKTKGLYDNHEDHHEGLQLQQLGPQHNSQFSIDDTGLHHYGHHEHLPPGTILSTPKVPAPGRYAPASTADHPAQPPTPQPRPSAPQSAPRASSTAAPPSAPARAAGSPPARSDYHHASDSDASNSPIHDSDSDHHSATHKLHSDEDEDDDGEGFDLD